MRVKCINNFNSPNFTTDKEYDCIRTIEGLQIIDDLDEEHIIVKKTELTLDLNKINGFLAGLFLLINLKVRENT